MSGANQILLGVSAVLLAGALGLVRRDYRQRRPLKGAPVAVVWAAYLVHAGVTAWFAWSAPAGRLGWPAVPAWMLGGFLIGVGVTFAAESIATFRSFERMSGLDTSQLVTGGIYAFSRNPQNLGWALALLGVAVVGRSPWALVLVALFVLVVHVYIVALEEPYLEGVYSEAYRRYRQRTSRYLGMPGG